MNNRHTSDSQLHLMQNWNQQGSGGPVPLSIGQKTPVEQSSTNGMYQSYGPGQPQYSAGPNQQYNAPSQPLYPGGPNHNSPPGQPPYNGGPSSGQLPYNGGPSSGQLPYNGGPSSGQLPYNGAPNQQYGPSSGQLPYNGAPNQQYGPSSGQLPYNGGPSSGQLPYNGGSGQHYGSPSGQLPYNGGSGQQYGSPSGQLPYNGGPSSGQLPYNGGSGQHYGSPSGQLPYNGGSGQHYGAGQPSFASGTYQPYGTGQPAFQPAYANQAPVQARRGPGWKALFFVIPVALVVFASIFGPNIIRNMQGNNNQVKANAGPQGQTVQTPEKIGDQQLQSIQQYNDTMRYKQLARLYTSQMTLDEEIGQLMVVTYSTNNYSQDLDYMLNQQHVGGVILYQLSFETQLNTADQVKSDVAMMQKRATFPLFISIDEEGWNVNRLGSVYPVPPNPKRLAADDIHQSGSTAVATSEGERVAHDMMALGINVNFAPDVDVATNHGYIDWDYRAFGENSDDVLKYSAPYLEAMQKGGVIGTLKHFVGLGAVPRGNTNDPHFVLPSVDLTRDQLDPHLATFKYFIQSSNKLDRPGFIMPTDLMVPAVDPQYPTEFSHTFITDILRNQLGYNGVIITDGLQMGGVKLDGETLTEAKASVLALKAGCDMLLDIAGSEQVAAVNAAIKSAIQDGSLSKARIDESVQRILELKMERNVVPSVQGIDMAN